MDRVFGGRYKIKRKLGAGSFGEIYEGENIKNGKRCAIKVERLKTQVPQLNSESKVYSLLSGSVNVPTLYYFGIEIKTCALVIDFLGQSLDSLRTSCSGRLPLKSVLMLAPQMISSLQFLHQMNLIHGDVKPENFMLGMGNNENKVYVIDFGLSRFYRDSTTHQHIPFTEHNSFSGTARYASISALRGNEQSRRDDMESLAYVWLFLLKGTVPWVNVEGNTLNEKHDRMCLMKLKSNPDQLFKDLPSEFATYLKEVRKLRFQDEPNYARYRKLFYDAFIRLGYKFDYKYGLEDPADVLVPALTPEQPLAQQHPSGPQSTRIRQLGMNELPSKPNICLNQKNLNRRPMKIYKSGSALNMLKPLPRKSNASPK